eukprot:365579-Chlamydomonas_euryale.AAC.3
MDAAAGCAKRLWEASRRAAWWALRCSVICLNANRPGRARGSSPKRSPDCTRFQDRKRFKTVLYVWVTHVHTWFGSSGVSLGRPPLSLEVLGYHFSVLSIIVAVTRLTCLQLPAPTGRHRDQAAYAATAGTTVVATASVCESIPRLDSNTTEKDESRYSITALHGRTRGDKERYFGSTPHAHLPAMVATPYPWAPGPRVVGPRALPRSLTRRVALNGERYPPFTVHRSPFTVHRSPGDR